MSSAALAETAFDPRRYFEAADDSRAAVAKKEPVCLYLEVTNRCNLLCTTCPRTYEELESPQDMSWEMFTKIVDQVPNIARVVLHGVGEPMLVHNLPRMIRYLKDRGTYVLFNTNGTLLTEKRGRELIDSGLDEMRISLDAAERESFKLVRGRDMFDRIVSKISAFTAMQAKLGVTNPKPSIWLTGLKETLDQLPDFVRLADRMGVREVYLQRLVYSEDGKGMARPEQALFESLDRQEAAILQDAQDVATELGIMFNASGATEPGTSVEKTTDDKPWSLCRRPWSLMYFTAHGRALPCCIAPFSMNGYDSFTLGDATQSTLREIWNGPGYQTFREALLGEVPPSACANCGLRWSL